MQIVNGYICMNCCDVDKARLGQDPHQQANQRIGSVIARRRVGLARAYRLKSQNKPLSAMLIRRQVTSGK
jgi:hypothetical protein